MPSISKRITFDAGPTSPGDIYDFGSPHLSSLDITNNCGESIAYSTSGGVGYTVLQNGATASLGSGRADMFRFRRVNSGGYPLWVDASVDFSSDNIFIASAISNNPVIIGNDKSYSLLDKTKVGATGQYSSLARGIVSRLGTNVTAVSGTLPASHQAAVAKFLPDLMRSTAYTKIRELTLHLGTDLNAARVKLIYPSGAASALTLGTLTAAGDYTELGGFNPGGVANHNLISDFIPNNVLGSADQGYAQYVFGAVSRGAARAAAANGSPDGYAGYTGGGNAFGTQSGAQIFGPHAATGNTRISQQDVGAAVTGGAVNAIGRFRATQQRLLAPNSWSIEAYVGGAMINSTTKTSLVANTGAIGVGGVNGGSWFNGSIGGYAYFDYMTPQELLELNKFFDNVNEEIGRQVFFEELLCCGDSNTLGILAGPVPPTAAQAWPTLVANQYGLTVNNQGYLGGTLDTNGANNLRGQIHRGLALSPRALVLMIGTNDTANAYTTLLGQYSQYLDWLQLVNIPNLLVLGVGQVDWPAAKAYYPGSGYDIQPHTTSDITNFNNAIEAMCASRYINFGRIDTLPNVLQTDGVHNTVASHASQATYISSVLRKSV